MSDDKKIKVILHRGARQIGGVCTEIATENTRLLFDFGSPLEGEGNQDILEIDGVTRGDVNCDAVFLTHYHGDHVGEIPRIMADIPVYMQKTARRILEAQQEHKVSVGQKVWAKDIKELTEGIPVAIKDLKVTPLASDHSASNSVMYLVEGYEKKILITGDYRLHGFNREKLMRTFERLKNVDLMITEGTNILRSSPYYEDEPSVKKKFAEVFSEFKYVFLLTSSSNIDRIVSFTRSVPGGEYPLVDDYQKNLLAIADEDREGEMKSKKSTQFIVRKTLARGEKAGFGMVIRTSEKFRSIVKEFVTKYPEDTCLIYSMWKGYKDFTGVNDILDLCKDKICIKSIHVSGHITKEDLELAIETVAPKKLIIHHTSAKEEEKKLIIPDDIEQIHMLDGLMYEL
ncbi:MBL fold metallo-hydrolase [Butyrivibrio sp. AC2005]|uniref:MBL fold metallo-hydrolase n=1 Tax=Butyrivibrio sp. AC2005 TaxID=1280672 RepID=UPI0003F8F6D0|nr:MBL fold metallo-hydrolase [Butyrivibrio sp. AC2005]